MTDEGLGPVTEVTDPARVRAQDGSVPGNHGGFTGAMKASSASTALIYRSGA